MSEVFTKKTFSAIHKKAITTLYALSTVVENAPNIMVRINTQNLSADKSDPLQANFDDIDTFIISTSANPDNQLYYKSPTNKFNLGIADGGYF